MKDNDKSREELIAELLKLREENLELKLSQGKNAAPDLSIGNSVHPEQVGLMSNNSYFEMMFNTSPDAALVSRLSDGLMVESNEGFSHMTGYSREEIFGKTTNQVKLWHDPEYRQSIINEQVR